MKKFKFKVFIRLIYRWISPFTNLPKLIMVIPRYISFFKDWVKYSQLNGAEIIKILDTYPCIHDKTSITDFDAHYFYQDIWAFKKIYNSQTASHIDIGSNVNFVGVLTAITKVIFIDIRPLVATLENFESKKGSVLSIPFEDNSVLSLSCLHVAEHIGLGRYGDTLDAFGTKKTCKELSRVLATNGNLYFSVPIGKPRLCFNAHRVHSLQQIITYFSGLKLIELSGIDDTGNFVKNIDLTILKNSNYACGLFHFTKKQ